MKNKKTVLAHILCLTMTGLAVMPVTPATADSWNDTEEKNYLVILRDDVTVDTPYTI